MFPSVLEYIKWRVHIPVVPDHDVDIKAVLVLGYFPGLELGRNIC